MVRKVALQSARSWLGDAQPGYCAGPRAELPATAQPASCVGRSGSFSLNSSSTSSWILAVSVCLSYCRSCPLCASISVSHKHDDCRWFSSTVDCKALKQSPKGYKSGPLLARNSSKQQARKAEKKVARKTATKVTADVASKVAELSRPFVRCERMTNMSAAASSCLIAVDRGNGVYIAGHRNRHGAGFCAQLPQT